jgi:hypothetical protein
MVKYSVLLPTHNQAELLRFAIQSVLKQTDPDFELLIAGDGCTDHSAQVVESFGDARIRWFDLPKAPHFGYANRNVVLREARGDYIAMVGHDDLLFPDHLACLGKCLEHAEWAYSRPLWVGPSGDLIPDFQSLHSPLTARYFFDVGNFIPTTSVMYRRECHLKYGFWDEKSTGGGDWELWKRMLNGGNRQNFSHLPLPTSLHFKAHWRTDKDFGSVIVRYWHQILADAQQIPIALHYPTSDDRPQQEYFWEAIETSSWVEQVREAVESVEHLWAGEYLARWIQIAELEVQQNHQKTQIQQHQAQIAQLEAQLQQSRAYNMDQDKHIEQLQSQVVVLETQIQQHQTCNAELNTQTQELQTQNAELETQIQQLQIQEAELNTQKEALQNYNTRLENQNQQLRVWNTELDRRTYQLDEQISVLKKQLMHLETHSTEELQVHQHPLETNNTRLHWLYFWKGTKKKSP